MARISRLALRMGAGGTGAGLAGSWQSGRRSAADQDVLDTARLSLPASRFGLDQARRRPCCPEMQPPRAAKGVGSDARHPE